MNEINNLHTLCVIKHRAVHVQLSRPLVIPQKSYIIKHASAVASSIKRKKPITA